MEDLIAFLRARLDEDERNGQDYLGEMLETRLEHDARFRLAEIAAKRRILDEFSWEAGETRAIVYLAQPYANREGFREEWRAS